MRKTILAATVGMLLTASALTAQTTAAMLDKEVVISIATQPMAVALQEFGRQAGLSVVMDSQVARGIMSHAVSGKLTTRAALQALLEGSGLRFELLDDRTVAIRSPSDQVSAKAVSGQRIAALSDSPPESRSRSIEASEPAAPPADDSSQPSPNLHEDWLAQVTVLGTHIRGVDAPVGAQLIRISRADIDKTGLPTVQDILRTLPQSFGGGVSETTIGAAGGADREAATNSTRGNAPNLRGLGAGSTLVLVNGRRIAPSGTEGAYTDLSSLALTAVERIDVLPDGASALYGSDAVGGVINIVTRQDYSGAETRVRYGSVTSGGAAEYQFAQSLGESWETGSGLVSMEYYHRDALPATARRQMDSDLRSFGGSNFDTNLCNPGTIRVGVQTFAIPPGQDGIALTPGDFAAGSQNLCNRNEHVDLFAEQKRWNAIGTVHQKLSDQLTIFADAAFSSREVTVDAGKTGTLLVPSTNAFYVNPTGGTGLLRVLYDLTDDLGPNHFTNEIRTSNIGFGGTIKFNENWQATTQLSYASDRQNQVQIAGFDSTLMNAALVSSDPAIAFNPFGEGANTSTSTRSTLAGSNWSTFGAEAELRMATLTVDGPLFTGPAGAIRLAFGGEIRKQAFDSTFRSFLRSVSGPTSSSPASLDRRVNAGFAELFIPIVGVANRRAGVNQLSFSLAGRYEDYDDFGSAAVPRIGMTWAPVSGVAVRGTWGKSYKAPNLADLVEANNTLNILPFADPSSPSGQSTILLWSGKNKDLKEETATTWALGLDFTPSAIQGLTVGLTYFNIDFENRIGGVPNSNLLADPINAFAVTRNPTAAERQEACSRGTFGSNFSQNPGSCTSASVDALVDGRLLNVAVLRERGVDLTSSYPWTTNVGNFTAGLSATYLLEYEAAYTDSTSTQDLLNRPTNPIDLKIRGSFGWNRGGLSASVFANYVNGYQDTISQPTRHVGSWTTLDLSVGYSFTADTDSVLSGLQLSLSAQNLLNEEAPFYNNAIGVGYDQANADLLGQFISFNIRKNW